MDEETQRKLIRLARQAMALISVNRLDMDLDLVFDLRDIIRKAESQMKGADHAPDEIR
jgi:hypothetical protein